MTRLESLVLCAALALGTTMISCGSSTSSGGTGGSGAGGAGKGGSGAGGSGAGGSSGSVLSLAPVNNNSNLSGWTVNSDFNGGAQNWPADKTQPAVSTTYKGVTDLIDGGAEPFFAGSFTPTTFLWQNYINTNLSAADSANAPGGYTLSLYLLQMPSATQASGLYASVLAPGSTFTLYTSNTWDALSPVIGDESRIADSGADWQINFHKGAYYVQVDLNPSYDSAGNPNAQSKAETIKFATYIASKM